MTTLFLILIALVSYFLGGINGSIIASRYIFKKDVRDFGSGNAGLTNFYRTFGPAGTAMVLATDIIKSVIAVLLGGALLGVVGHAMVGKLFAGFCLILGHMFPAFYAYKGGKGALCGGTLMLMIDWRVGLICLLVFAVSVVFTRYVSLSSMLGALCAPIGIWVFGLGGLEGWLAMFCALLIIFKHKDNIIRLINGTETKIKFSSGRGSQRS